MILDASANRMDARRTIQPGEDQLKRIEEDADQLSENAPVQMRHGSEYATHEGHFVVSGFTAGAIGQKRRKLV